jgi:ankyrin repeat protein
MAGHLEMVRLFLDAKATVDDGVDNDSNNTPLYVAVLRCKRASLVELLLEGGATLRSSVWAAVRRYTNRPEAGEEEVLKMLALHGSPTSAQISTGQHL